MMRTGTLRRIIAGVATIGVGLAVMAGPAGAATGSETFRIIFTGDPHSGAIGRVVATGVINSRGTDETIASTPNPDGTSTDTDLITLRGGTVTIDNTDMLAEFTLDPASCVARLRGGGPYSVDGGTGAYTGASGGGTFTATGAIVFKRSGATCTDEPQLFFVLVTASGTISIP
jgi:hypothetical protein